MSDKRSRNWLITATVEVQEKVVFDKPLTIEEAEEAYLEGDWADIIDTDQLGVDEVISLKSY